MLPARGASPEIYRMCTMTTRAVLFVTSVALQTALMVALAACSGGGGASPIAARYTIGGSVTGLSGSGLVLQFNGGNNLVVPSLGAFAFQGTVGAGSAFTVTVLTQPSTPTQSCAVVNGSGTVGTASVTNIAVNCTGTEFTALSHQPPASGYLTLLLTDGTVMMQSNNNAGVFYALVPDLAGDYLNGTWHRLASPPAGYAPYAGAQAVLADGRVLFVGGEYNQNQYSLPFAPSGLTNMSALYDPIADSWTMIAAPPGVAYIGDPSSVVLTDGSFVYGDKLGRSMWRLDSVSLTWTSMAAVGKADDFAEEGWTLLPNGDLFTVDVGTPRHAEHYNVAAGQWFSDGMTPNALTSPTGYPAGLTYGPAPASIVGGVHYGPGATGTYFPPGEIGPALLLPDGSVFVTGAAVGGAAAHTALYTPGLTSAAPGTFASGPDFAPGDDAEDASAALLPSGHVLIATSSGRFYEYDGTTLSATAALSNNGGRTEYFILPLPNGQALVTGGVTQV